MPMTPTPARPIPPRAPARIPPQVLTRILDLVGGGADTMRALSDALPEQAGTLGRAVDRLVADGLLARDGARLSRPGAQADDRTAPPRRRGPTPDASIDERIRAAIDADPDGKISAHAATAGCPTRRVRAAVDRLGLRPGWLYPARPSRASSACVGSMGAAQPTAGAVGGQPSPRGRASGAPHGAGEPESAGAPPAPAAVVTRSTPPAARPADPPVDVARVPSGAAEPPAEAPERVEPAVQRRRRSAKRDALVAYVAAHHGATTNEIAQALGRSAQNVPRDAGRAGLVSRRVEPMPWPLRWYPSSTCPPPPASPADPRPGASPPVTSPAEETEEGGSPTTSPPPVPDERPATAAVDVLVRPVPMLPVDPEAERNVEDFCRRTAPVRTSSPTAPAPDVLVRLRVVLPEGLEVADEDVLGAVLALAWMGARGGR